jgi:hypothetical protein
MNSMCACGLNLGSSSALCGKGNGCFFFHKRREICRPDDRVSVSEGFFSIYMKDMKGRMDRLVLFIASLRFALRATERTTNQKSLNCGYESLDS